TSVVQISTKMPPFQASRGGPAAAKRFPDLRYQFMSEYTANLISVQPGGRTNQADFIQKPFSRLALARKVREMLVRA
ncbi:MAG TPA: hypothetical protein PKX16_04975, partial [Kiritimatiellia bacterium]|nr:hypothetical protein [Kiritimatiellia bacterium]